MIKRIGEWWYAYKVLRKYKLKFYPYVSLDSGWYSYDRVIGVNPFCKHFISVFLHEIGHHVHDKRVGLESYLKAGEDDLRFPKDNTCIYKTLESEAFASRFAAKTGRASRKQLLVWYNTYTASIFKGMRKSVVVNEFSEIVDCVYKNSRRIEK